MKKAILVIVALVAVNLTQAQWGPDVRLTNDAAVSWTSMNSCKPIVARGDSIHVVWQDFRDLNGEIYYKYSTDGGISWSTDTRLTTDPGKSYDPGIALSVSVIHVVWADLRVGPDNGEIYYKRSEDGGSTWGADTRLTFDNSWSESPSIAIEDSVIHLVWYDYRDATVDWDYEIYYKRSTDRGLTWEPDVRLTNNPSYSGFPCVAVSGSMVHVVWEDDRDGSLDVGSVYYKRSSDGGITWGPDKKMTDEIANAWDPVIAVSGSDVHMVWHDSRDGGAREIYYKHSSDGGLTWGPDTRLTNAFASSEWPTITVSGSMLHVVWGDKRDMTFEIYYKRSQDAGLTWEEDTRLTNAFGESNFASVAVSDLALHVIWKESRDGNEEIYYKRNPTGSLVVGIEDILARRPGQLFAIYPNPASNKIHIQMTDYPPPKSVLTIRNNLGEKLVTKQIRINESDVDVSSLPNGLYFIEIAKSNKQIEIRKLVILK